MPRYFFCLSAITENGEKYIKQITKRSEYVTSDYNIVTILKYNFTFGRQFATIQIQDVQILLKLLYKRYFKFKFILHS